LNFKSIAAVFVVLTVVFGAATGYLLSTSSGSTTTATVVTTSIQTTTASGVGSAFSVNIAYQPDIGFYLVNGSGSTLYYRTTDFQSNGTSTCTGTCTTVWPVFYTANLVLPPGLNAGSFKAVTRADGKQQLTYNGWPLYFYYSDQKPGDDLGQGISGIWFAYNLPTPSHTGSSTTTTSTDAPTTSTSSSTTTTSSSTSLSSSSTTSTKTSTTSTTTSTASSTTTTTSSYYY